MVHCLWMSTPFEKGVYIDPQILENTEVTEYRNSLNLVHHPSLLSYAACFLLQVSVFKTSSDFMWQHCEIGTVVFELQGMFRFFSANKILVVGLGFKELKESLFSKRAWPFYRDRIVNQLL